MADNANFRMLDGGGPVLIEEHKHDPPEPCAHSVCVETRYDGTRDELTLLLRHAGRHDGGCTKAYGDRVAVTVSLTTGRCAARDPLAERFLSERPWFETALLGRLDWLRTRARRHAAQRDRLSTSFAVLDRTEPGIMVRHDVLFPNDWDLLFQHDGRYLWATDLHCSNPECPCADVLIELRDPETFDAPLIGKIQVELNDVRPIASPSTMAKMFEALWEEHGQELQHRQLEVRQIVAEHAARRASAAVVIQPTPSPSRNAPCPCGSGKKFKRCCAAALGEPRARISTAHPGTRVRQ